MFWRAYRFLTLLLLTQVLSCTSDFPGYDQVEEGGFLKVMAIGDGDFTPAIGQHLSYKLRILNDSKVEIYRTSKRGIDKYEHLYYTHNKSGLIQRNLEKFHVGDSLSFIMSPELLREQFTEITEIDNSNFFQVELKIIHLENDIERNNRLEGLHNYAKLNEEIIIDNYFSSNGNKEEFIFWNNLFIKTHIKGKRSVNKNNHLILKYKAYFLNGTLFDETTDSTFIKYSFGESAQVVDGLTRAISKIGVDSKAEIIIPSSLAFGDEGSSSGIVPPNTPLRYELEVLEDTTLEKY